MSITLGGADKLDPLNFPVIIDGVALDFSFQRIYRTGYSGSRLNHVQSIKFVQKTLKHSNQMLCISRFNSVAHIIPKHSTPILVGILMLNFPTRQFARTISKVAIDVTVEKLVLLLKFGPLSHSARTHF